MKLLVPGSLKSRNQSKLIPRVVEDASVWKQEVTYTQTLNAALLRRKGGKRKGFGFDRGLFRRIFSENMVVFHLKVSMLPSGRNAWQTGLGTVTLSVFIKKNTSRVRDVCFLVLLLSMY